MDAKLYEQDRAVIYGHNVWHYLIDTPIGQYHIVRYEDAHGDIKETVIPHNNDKAEEAFQKYCKDLIAGRYL